MNFGMKEYLIRKNACKDFLAIKRSRRVMIERLQRYGKLNGNNSENNAVFIL